MKKVFLVLGLIPAISFAQQKYPLTDTIQLKESFTETVNEGVKKYFNKHRTNDFFNKNLNKQPIVRTNDSVVYQMKFLTRAAGSYLWDTKTIFKKQGNSLIVVLDNIKLYKKKGTSIDTVDKPIEQLEANSLINANIEALKKEAEKFFKYFK